MRFWLQIAMALALLLAAAPPDLHAQIKGKGNRVLPPGGGPKGKDKGIVPGAALERFLQMPPDQRRRALEQLPPARRRLVLQRLALLEVLNPEELRVLRGRYQAFVEMLPGRRQAVRAEIRTLRALPAQERRRHLGSEEVRSRFSEQELQLLYEVAGVPDAQ